MRNKWKTAFWILLTAALVILGAFLPGILTTARENLFIPGFADISSVELQLRSSDGAYLKDALSLTGNAGTTVSVTENMTVHTEEEILELAQSHLQPYLDQGLILMPDLDIPMQTFSCEPHLMVSQGDNAGSAIFWNLQIQFDKEEPALWLRIEDRTGALVLLDYHCSKAGSFEAPFFRKDESIYRLCETYFGALGEEFSAYVLPEIIQNYTDIGGSEVQHCSVSWEGRFGTAGVTVDVWQYGVTIMPI